MNPVAVGGRPRAGAASARRRRFRRSRRRLAAGLVGALGLLVGATAAAAAITPGGPVRVRILYDNSGSMYPGYGPLGSGTPKSVSGAKYFHQYEDFQHWLGDFVARQSILDGSTVSMSTFTSQGVFTAADIRLVHPEVPLAEFDVARALASFPAEVGRTTYLLESLDQFSQGFEGLVWLITDNIVETRAGQPDAGVRRFFETLLSDGKYRSVHLFKLPFRDERAGQESGLAVYGILVAPEDPSPSTLAYYDRKLRSTFLAANRSQGDPPPALFPGREHLKLKDISIDALELEDPKLEVILDDGQIREGERLGLQLKGKIRSHLTQHSVTAGHYRVDLVSPFAPEPWASHDLGFQAFEPALFEGSHGEIERPIPPQDMLDIGGVLRSVRPLSFRSSGLNWLRLAFSGANVKYTGTVRMSFDAVEVRQEREHLAGIFGIDQASSLLNFQDVNVIAVKPSEAQVSFALASGNRRTAVLLVLLAVLLSALAVLLVWLTRKRWYYVRISGAPERLVALRRLGGHAVVHEGQPLGRLSRGIYGDYGFTPSPPSAAVNVAATADPDTYDVRFRDGKGCQLSIEPRGGGKRTAKRPRLPPVGPPNAGPTATRPAAATSLPKIDRP